jgi:C4-dicarboxylate-specific signal transduction histidine kinase
MAGLAGRGAVTVATLSRELDRVTVRVEDQGPPIDDAAFRGLFTPFHTTKPDGLGMGLAISRSIVQAHGGHLWAERRQEGGLIVQFTLPVRA